MKTLIAKVKVFIIRSAKMSALEKDKSSDGKEHQEQILIAFSAKDNQNQHINQKQGWNYLH